MWVWKATRHDSLFVLLPKFPIAKANAEGKEVHLKHVDTEDKSKPHIEKGVKIKKSNRGELLQEVTKEHSLKHAETTDKSKPHIEKDTHIKESSRPALLSEVKKGVELKKTEG